jgi:penicillin amidase
MRWLGRGMAAVLLLVLVAAAALGLYARRVLPQTTGVIEVAGAKAAVRIERDTQGVPSIEAASREDAMFGLGFAHAQDRLWQLETHRRIGAGRLAEVFGPGALDTDRFLRALGVRRAAAEQWAKASASTRAALTAYAAGVNAGIAQLSARPPEFVLLGIQPEPWTPIDSLSWAIMMAWDLGTNWSSELFRMRMALSLPVDRINELMPPYPGEKPLPTADYAALFRGLQVDGRLGRQALLSAPESGIEGVGSNNWVVAGSHSETGMPLLANDPHLKLSAPALWYVARMSAPGFKVAGATLPGLPFVVLGQNENVAWGFTNTGADVQDLYLERIKPDDASRYQTPDGWAAFERFEEVIKVKGAADVAITVRRSRHGPVISDAGGPTDGLIGPKGQPTYALAMRWVALDADPGTMDAGIGFDTARSVDEFIAAAEGYVAPMQNMVVADKAGHIGMVSAGRVPLRKPENDLKGLVPSPGWDARYDWAGMLDPKLTPRQIDPPRGWIASANQRITEPGYAHFLTSEWSLPYRQQRIEQLLQARPKHSLESLRELQADQLSLAAPPLLPYLWKAESSHPLAAAAQAQLNRFDGTMAADKAAPLIFWAWTRQLTQGVFADEVGSPTYDAVIGSRNFRDSLQGVLERNDAFWCDDKTTPATETCDAQNNAAFTRALDELQQRFGSDVSKWHWSDAHQARSEHRPFSRVRPLAALFELRTPVGGDTYTVNAGRVGMKADGVTGELYLDEHGPSLRSLYDVKDLAQSTMVQSTGQSGIVFSPLYRNWVERWTKVEALPLWAKGPAEAVLTLQPKP